MDRCKAKCGFSLLAVYFRFVTSQIDFDIVNEIIRVNNIDTRGVMLSIRTFVHFLFNMKTCIEKILDDSFTVKVYNSLDFMEEWSFHDHAFELCEHGNLKKLPKIDQSIAVTIRYAGDFICQDEDCMILHDGDMRKVFVQCFCLWQKISKGMKNYQHVLETFKFFTKNFLQDLQEMFYLMFLKV